MACDDRPHMCARCVWQIGARLQYMCTLSPGPGLHCTIAHPPACAARSLTYALAASRNWPASPPPNRYEHHVSVPIQAGLSCWWPPSSKSTNRTCWPALARPQCVTAAAAVARWRGGADSKWAARSELLAGMPVWTGTHKHRSTHTTGTLQAYTMLAAIWKCISMQKKAIIHVSRDSEHVTVW